MQYVLKIFVSFEPLLTSHNIWLGRKKHRKKSETMFLLFFSIFMFSPFITLQLHFIAAIPQLPIHIHATCSRFTLLGFPFPPLVLGTDGQHVVGGAAGIRCNGQCCDASLTLFTTQINGDVQIIKLSHHHIRVCEADHANKCVRSMK